MALPWFSANVKIEKIIMKKFIVWISIVIVLVSSTYVFYKNYRIGEVKKSIDKDVLYTLTFKNEKFLENIKKDIEKIGFELNKNEWSLILN